MYAVGQVHLPDATKWHVEVGFYKFVYDIKYSHETNKISVWLVIASSW
jgi:hypothetical protein